MSKYIRPSDDSLTTPQSLPDRSALSELYGKPLGDISKSSLIKTEADENAQLKPGAISGKSHWELVIITNLLLVVPSIVSYLSISQIHTLAEPTDIPDAASNRLIGMALTISTSVPWIVSLRYLSKQAS